MTLVYLTQALAANTSLEEQELRAQIESLFSQWYVICSVTGKEIPLNELRYWDCSEGRQEMYAGPEVVPARYWHLPYDPRPELKEYWAKRDPGRLAPDEQSESAV